MQLVQDGQKIQIMFVASTSLICGAHINIPFIIKLTIHFLSMIT